MVFRPDTWTPTILTPPPHPHDFLMDFVIFAHEIPRRIGKFLQMWMLLRDIALLEIWLERNDRVSLAGDRRGRQAPRLKLQLLLLIYLFQYMLKPTPAAYDDLPRDQRRFVEEVHPASSTVPSSFNGAIRLPSTS